jgi:hypothetical protein
LRALRTAAGIVVWPRSVIVDFSSFITFTNALYYKMYEFVPSFSYCLDFVGLVRWLFFRVIGGKVITGVYRPFEALVASLRASN